MAPSTQTTPRLDATASGEEVQTTTERGVKDAVSDVGENQVV